MKIIKHITEWIFYLVLLILITVALITPVCLFVETEKPSLPEIKIDTENIALTVNKIIEAESTQPTEVPVPKKHIIKDFDVIYQTPELPTGCEITAFAMALNYHGFKVNKEALALYFLPRKEPVFTEKDGKKYGHDLNRFFIGNPSTDIGYVCGTQAVITAAEKYFRFIRSDSKVVDITGSQPEDLYRYVSRNIPVTVWVTIELRKRESKEGWYTEDGQYVEWDTVDHGAVLIGYDENTVTIADPLSGIVTYEKKEFEDIFKQRGNQCVIIEK